jgi:ribonucleoside-diphosphate reductase alpha chain
MDAYQSYIHKSRYARYLPEEGRRETWAETVQRYVQFFKDKGHLKSKEAEELYEAIHNLDVMPSMRALMTAGGAGALDRDNVAGFNCAYLAIDSPRSFDEMMYILLCGTGVGYSVERQYINKLPVVEEDFHETETIIHVADSKIGWAKSFRELVSLLYSGQIPRWDVSRVRPSGSVLKTFGGRASGPEPLVELFNFTVGIFKGAAGRKLNSLECHDLACKIAEIVVVGGVRRSALISLSNLTDDRLKRAKHGNWWDHTPHRALANNSACYTEKPDFEAFLNEWSSLYESKAGERGIFSRVASQKQAAKNGRRDANYAFGTNPCSEIVLRGPKLDKNGHPIPNTGGQFCNLSEVVVRPEDTIEELKWKVRLATILGTLQATLTDFRYLRGIWKKNTEEEALLGVSLTGIMDNSAMTLENPQLPELLEELKNEAIKTNKEWAKRLGIKQSAAITCVKPSGTVSQLVDSASGIHPRYSEYYIRTVRADKRDPLCTVLKDAGVPCEDDLRSPSTLVFSFPKRSPEGVYTASEVRGYDQLLLWEVYQEHWCEHKPSMTCYYRDDEFLEIGQWVYNKFDSISGISFLPYDGHVYEQAPYQPISKEKYEELIADFPKEFDWDIIEEQDNTEGTQTLACTGDSCEI